MRHKSRSITWHICYYFHTQQKVHFVNHMDVEHSGMWNKTKEPKMTKMEIYNSFNKKFTFKNENCELPSVDQFYSESASVEKYEPLQTIKRILNFVKSKLNNLKIEGNLIVLAGAFKSDFLLRISEWSQHTKRRNPASQIVYHLKNVIKAEFVTQAFSKFYECINSYPMISENLGEKFFSVHLCEAPVSISPYLILYFSTLIWFPT